MEPQAKPLGAPEHLDVPFELKTVEIVTQDDGLEINSAYGFSRPLRAIQYPPRH